jgi:hypothetical protein
VRGCRSWRARTVLALADRAVLDAWLAQVVQLAMVRGALRWNRPAR